jgi:general secretion pathway protein D
VGGGVHGTWQLHIAALNALATENKVNILSNPSIMTSENKKAVINVSTSVPIVTSQQVPVAAGGATGNSITQAVEYKDASIILTVTPRIGEQGPVSLDVKQEVNDVGENEPPPINSPRFRKREAETSVVLLNNQTPVLGGLIQNKRARIRTGIPFLNRMRRVSRSRCAGARPRSSSPSSWLPKS